MKSIKDDIPDIGLPLSGKLAELRWIKTSRKPPPSEKAAHSSDIAYNVETAEDIGKAFRRQAAAKLAK